jgi:hypothetical protein
MKNKLKPPLNITLDSHFIKDPSLLLGSKDFISKIRETTLDLIKSNIDLKEEKLHILNLVSFGLKVSISSKDQVKFLENLLEEYTKEEEFNKCAEIVSYINKIKK